MSQFNSRNQSIGVLVWLLVAYLAWDFVRPHELVPALKYTRFSLVLTLILALPIIHKSLNEGLFNEKVVVAVLVFFFLCYVSLLWVYNQGYWRACFRGSVFIILIQFLGLAVLLDDNKKVMLIVKSLIIFHAYIGVFGIINLGRGPGSFLTDENDLALALNTIMPIAYFLSLDSSSSKLMRRIYLISAVLMFLGVVTSNSRGGFVGLAAAIGVCFLLTKTKKYFIFAVIAFGIVVSPFISERYIEEISSITDITESTADGRLWSWKLALDMYKDNPVLGVGMCNYRFRVAEYEQHGLGGRWGDIRVSLAGRVSHSIYFTIIPELGTLGILVFIGVVYYYFRSLIGWSNNCVKAGSYDSLRFGLIAGMVGYLVSGAFLTAIYNYPQFWILCGLAVALKRTYGVGVERGDKNDDLFGHSH